MSGLRTPPCQCQNTYQAVESSSAPMSFRGVDGGVRSPLMIPLVAGPDFGSEMI
jgi:hypothetical protein